MNNLGTLARAHFHAQDTSSLFSILYILYFVLMGASLFSVTVFVCAFISFVSSFQKMFFLYHIQHLYDCAFAEHLNLSLGLYYFESTVSRKVVSWHKSPWCKSIFTKVCTFFYASGFNRSELH